MRRQFVKTIEAVMAEDERLVLLLGDIGVYGFRNAFRDYPGRVYNIGILEQASIGVVAGLAAEGFVPIFHSIAPFAVERALEQIKIDLGYQNLKGIIVSVGASYDYASLGCTHQAPGDVAIMKTIPGIRVVAPGSPDEFDRLFRQSYKGEGAIYFRLSEQTHSMSTATTYGRAELIRKGRLGSVIVVGPLLKSVCDACADLDVSVLYYTTVAPFDRSTLVSNAVSDRVAIVEPFYEGTLCHEVASAFAGQRSVRLLNIGVPRTFQYSYGTVQQHDTECGFTAESLRMKLNEFFRTC